MLDADLLAAYRATSYTVHDAEGREVAVRIGEASPAMDDLLNAHDCIRAAFVTAWNPRSERRGREPNDLANEVLSHEMTRLSRRTLPHVGFGDDPSWEPERGYLALDIDPEEAANIAARFGQYAIVAVARGEPARLVLTTLDGRE